MEVIAAVLTTEQRREQTELEKQKALRDRIALKAHRAEQRRLWLERNWDLGL